MRITLQTFFVFLPCALLLHRNFSRGAMILALLIVPLALIIQKQFLFLIGRALHARGHGVERVAIYGAGCTGRRVLSALLQCPKLGFEPCAIFDDDPGLEGKRIFELGYRRTRSLAVRTDRITPEALRSCECDSLVIAIPGLSQRKLYDAVDVAEKAGIRIAVVAGQPSNQFYWTNSMDIDDLLLASPSDAGNRWHYELTKRGMDILGSLFLLLLISPFLSVIAIMVALDSRGPSIFVQERVGRGGRLFNMYKFRSMRAESPAYGNSPTSSDDPRITRMGRFLRRTSLDEIPQLINVLKGEMSLVGPRPEMPFIVDAYDRRQRQRLNVLPGITGLWQLSADRAYEIHESIQYDLYYIQHRGVFLDLAILVHTLLFAMRGI
jgi:exopolysaccharide biosynthesis polyprenyl glycosylphosphotransferase